MLGPVMKCRREEGVRETLLGVNVRPAWSSPSSTVGCRPSTTLYDVLHVYSLVLIRFEPCFGLGRTTRQALDGQTSYQPQETRIQVQRPVHPRYAR